MKNFVFFLIASLVIFSARAQDKVFTFNSLSVPDTGFYNGSDGKGFFSDTAGDTWIKLYNSYDSTWNSWQGWAYSTWKDDSTEGYTNQWSAYPGYLIDSTFALAYVGVDWNNGYKNIPAGIKFSKPINPVSVYIANSTYTALTIKKGNNFARAFKKGDYFKLIIIGYKDSAPTDTIEHYLADYRDNIAYIQKDWAYIDLSSLGIVDSMSFNVFSTDTGNFGMNTPAYFAMDQLRFIPSTHTAAVNNYNKLNFISIYPNPATTYFTVPGNTRKTILYNMQGQEIGMWKSKTIPVSTIEPGIYIVKLWDGRQWVSQKLIIRH